MDSFHCEERENRSGTGALIQLEKEMFSLDKYWMMKGHKMTCMIPINNIIANYSASKRKEKKVEKVSSVEEGWGWMGVKLGTLVKSNGHC